MHTLNRTFYILILSVVVFISAEGFSQQSKLSKGVNYITGFIASGKFSELRKNNDDLALTDSIFLRALNFEQGDCSETLFALTFAVIPYKVIPIKLPLLPVIIQYPLTSSDIDTYNRKNGQLPRYFYFDSPQNNYGDKDKLAHFFGSAFITYNSNFFDLGDLIGYFVEVFEQNFKVQSAVDPRDLHTNEFGDMFGEILKENKIVLPSQVMLMKTLFYARYHL